MGAPEIAIRIEPTITRAYACEDCGHIGANAMRCERCHSAALLNLGVVLNRERETALGRMEKE